MWIDVFKVPKAWCAVLRNEAGDQIADALYTYRKSAAKAFKIADFQIWEQYKEPEAMNDDQCL